MHPVAVLLSGKDHLSFPQLLQLLCRVEALWAFPGPLCDVYWCHPSLSHFKYIFSSGKAVWNDSLPLLKHQDPPMAQGHLSGSRCCDELMDLYGELGEPLPQRKVRGQQFLRNELNGPFWIKRGRLYKPQTSRHVFRDVMILSVSFLWTHKTAICSCSVQTEPMCLQGTSWDLFQVYALSAMFFLPSEYTACPLLTC